MGDVMNPSKGPTNPRSSHSGGVVAIKLAIRLASAGKFCRKELGEAGLDAGIGKRASSQVLHKLLLERRCLSGQRLMAGTVLREDASYLHRLLIAGGG